MIERLPVRSRMERVFFDPISNALEATPQGGEIRIGLRSAQNCVLIEVEDTGPRIPFGIRGRLFQPLATAGWGWGLALSRRTVLDHGGDMWTEPAAGVHFTIRLALKEDEDVLSQSLSWHGWSRCIRPNSSGRPF
jgi:signal transduction histidine kinase